MFVIAASLDGVLFNESFKDEDKTILEPFESMPLTGSPLRPSLVFLHDNKMFEICLSSIILGIAASLAEY